MMHPEEQNMQYTGECTEFWIGEAPDDLANQNACLSITLDTPNLDPTSIETNPFLQLISLWQKKPGETS